MDLVAKEKPDLFIIAGNLFDSFDISKNLQDFIAAQFSELNDTKIVILPEQTGSLAGEVFWKSWDSLKALDNISVLLDEKKPFVRFEKADCTVYRISKSNSNNVNQIIKDHRSKNENTKNNIGALYCDPENAKAVIENLDKELNYICLGGSNSFLDLTDSGIMAAYSGAPEKLDFRQENAGFIASVDIDSQNQPTVAKKKVGKFSWHSLEIDAKEILSIDDLIDKIRQFANPDSLLRLRLSGLALFESALSPAYIRQSLEDEFLYLDIIDEMKVLPGNVSEVKVSEKTILGQYIKLMAQEINNCDDDTKPRLEKSLKIGYGLLQGRESW